jgi:hypothetical protein
MASTYSQYKIELVGTGEQAGTWGTTTNNNFGSATPGTYQGFEQAIGGRADVTMSGTTTLSLTNSNAAQDARALYLNLSGTLSGAADLVVPALQKSYLVKNGTTGGFAVTIKVIGQTGVSIPNGKTVWVYNNGTDVVTAVDFIPEIATTTVDTTNIEVTNIKAKDGTAAGSIADSTGVVTLASSVLTTTDINGGTIDGAVIGGASADAGSFTTLNTSGAVVFNDAGADVDFRVEGDTDANLLFVDASTDRIGIGTNAPTDQLHLSGAASGVRVQRSISSDAGLRSTTTLGDFACGTGIGSATNCWNVYDIAAVAERMRIDSAGNVGIGTISPATKFEISGSGVVSLISGTSTLANYLQVRNTGTANSLHIGLDNSAGGIFNTGSAYAPFLWTQAGSMHFVTNSGSNIMQYNSGFLRLNTGGIQFNGDTAAANALDDYEEGTTTVTFTPSTSGTITLNASYQTVAYTKVGRLVTITGELLVSSVSTPVGTSVSIGNLPFAAGGASTALSSGFGIVNLGTGGVVGARVNTTANTIDLRVDASTIGAFYNIVVGFSYMT